MSKKIQIGIVAPSSKIPLIELNLGVKKIIESGFGVKVHSQCKKSHLFFAGNDQERADAFYSFATDPSFSVIWCARGGYGSTRILPLLEKRIFQEGIPKKKLLVGYSDSTALMEYVNRKWGWPILHGPMPSMRRFSVLPEGEWDSLCAWLNGQIAKVSWSGKKLTFWTPPPEKDILAKVVGGNLTVWNSLLGTRFQGQADECILFLEDVDEGLYRIDRMMQQMILSGSLDKVRAIVLGNFLNCKDSCPSVLKKKPSQKALRRTLLGAKPSELKPLRKTLKEIETLRAIFSEVGERLGIPVAFGLPVGHGPDVAPMPLGAEYRLSTQGHLELSAWDWLG